MEAYVKTARPINLATFFGPDFVGERLFSFIEELKAATGLNIACDACERQDLTDRQIGMLQISLMGVLTHAARIGRSCEQPIITGLQRLLAAQPADVDSDILGGMMLNLELAFQGQGTVMDVPVENIVGDPDTLRRYTLAGRTLVDMLFDRIPKDEDGQQGKGSNGAEG